MATTARTARKLPDALRSHVDALDEALAAPYPLEWREEDDYREALQPEAIGGVLVRTIHSGLANAKIGYLFREKLKDRDRARLAQASRVSGKLAHYSELDLLVEVNWETWRFLTDEQRAALIDHELAHFTREEDSKGRTVYKIVSHDLEEFNAIVRRWGRWKRDVDHFARALEASPQLGIFDNTLV